MPIVSEDEPRRFRKRLRWPLLFLAVPLLPLLFPWQVQIRRYTVSNHPDDPQYWGVRRFVDSVSGTDVIEVNSLGPLQIGFLRPKTGWKRPWPF